MRKLNLAMLVTVLGMVSEKWPFKWLVVNTWPFPNVLGDQVKVTECLNRDPYLTGWNSTCFNHHFAWFLQTFPTPFGSKGYWYKSQTNNLLHSSPAKWLTNNKRVFLSPQGIGIFCATKIHDFTMVSSRGFFGGAGLWCWKICCWGVFQHYRIFHQIKWSMERCCWGPYGWKDKRKEARERM